MHRQLKPQFEPGHDVDLEFEFTVWLLTLAGAMVGMLAFPVWAFPWAFTWWEGFAYYEKFWPLVGLLVVGFLVAFQARRKLHIWMRTPLFLPLVALFCLGCTVAAAAIVKLYYLGF